MKNLPIVVAHKDTNEVVTYRTVKNKDGSTEDVGVIMVRSTVVTGFSGRARLSNRYAFITLNEDVVDYLEGQIIAEKPFPIPGKIVIRDTLTPYVKANGQLQEPQINPSTGEIITFEGEPVYRNMLFTENLNDVDYILRDVRVETTEASPSETPE